MESHRAHNRVGARHDRLPAWCAAAGYAVILLGIAGAAFERGSPPVNARPDELVAFWSSYHRDLLAQSLVFVLSAGTYLIFFGLLRAVFINFEGRSRVISNIGFASGATMVTLQLILQSLQIAVARSAVSTTLAPATATLFANSMWSLSVVAYVPTAIMLGAASAVSYKYGALPRWLAALSAASAILHLVMAAGLVVDGGPLMPGAPLTYVLYASLLIWLVATSTVMWVRAAKHSFSPHLHESTDEA